MCYLSCLYSVLPILGDALDAGRPCHNHSALRSDADKSEIRFAANALNFGGGRDNLDVSRIIYGVGPV